MKTIFQKANASWAKYSAYEYRQGEDGILYLLPARKAKPSVYDPMKDAETLVIDALNVGRLAMKRGSEEKLKQAVLEFVTKYGLLGFMPALPTTPNFMDYDAVYLPKNHFINEEAMSAQEYLSRFFPFEKPDIYKEKGKMQWNVSAAPHEDRAVLALSMAFSNEPMAMGMSLRPIYAERFDWLATQFRDWAFTLVSTVLYYEDYDTSDELTKEIYQRGVAAFGGIAPTYHIGLYKEKPALVWDFHSLLLTIQTMLGFAMTDDDRPLRLCKHCNLAFAAGHPNAVFCSPRCKNQFNVYKSRGKKKPDAD